MLAGLVEGFDSEKLKAIRKGHLAFSLRDPEAFKLAAATLLQDRKGMGYVALAEMQNPFISFVMLESPDAGNQRTFVYVDSPDALFMLELEGKVDQELMGALMTMDVSALPRLPGMGGPSEPDGDLIEPDYDYEAEPEDISQP